MTTLREALAPADVAAANALTRRWLTERDEVPSAASGLGVWPLLGMLAAGAAGDTRTELLDALGLDPERAAALPRALLDGASGSEALRIALGVWAGPNTVLDPDWADALPDGTVGSLTGDAPADQAALDDWASRGTGGLIERMPIDLEAAEAIELLLASALTVRTRWRTPFEERDYAPVGTGPWAGLERVRLLDAGYHEDVLRIGDDHTVLTVLGSSDIDVLLGLGRESDPPRAVVGALLDAVDPAWGRSAATLGAGAEAVGVRTVAYRSPTPQTGPEVRATTVAFDVEAELPLLRDRAALGLVLAADRDRARFDRLSARPLFVSQAKQTCTAAFSAEGFEAAAVTAIGMAFAGAAPPTETYEHVRADVTLDRPFAYAAVHRPTGLVLVAGWVTEPARS